MANAGQDLINVYQALQNNGGDASTLPGQFPLLMFQGDMVNVGVNGTGDYSTFATSLRDLGMQISASDPTYMLAEGYLPISQLPAVAQAPQTLSLQPNDRPITQSVGAANNQGDASLQANTAREQFGVDGTGVTIGVLSNSVNQASNPAIPDFTNRPPGLAGSVQTGDLPNNVNVVLDGPAGSDDEGRAMLENIHDIAPGASLAFSTTGDSILSMAKNIQTLASQSGAKVLVDDVGYLRRAVLPGWADLAGGQQRRAERSDLLQRRWQRGERRIPVAVPPRDGHDRQHQPESGDVHELQPGRRDVTTQLPIITTAPDVPIVFQFDQPFKTQEPASSPAAPTSQLNFYVLDQTGKIVVSGVTNNVATQAPIQIVTIPNPGNYTVAVQLVSGPAPGHIEFLDPANNFMTVNQRFGAAGGTFYPTTYGHPTDQNAIGVGAVPWWATAPFLNQNPLQSEPFSSFGPALQVFDVNGNKLAAPATILAPVVSGPDGGNTSFFGQVIDTSMFPVPGEPATTTNLSQPNIPSFLGTSSSAPNVAAVATLMLQLNPELTPAQIRGAMTSTAAPLDGAPGGTYTAQGGFGYVNAVGALNASGGIFVAPGTLQFRMAAYSVPEDAGVATITVVRASTSSGGAVTVAYSTSNGTGQDGLDYVATSGTLKFNPGETFKTFTVPILFNPQNTSGKTVNLTLSNPAGDVALGNPSTAVLTIQSVSVPRVVNLSTVPGRNGVSTILVTFSKPLNPQSAMNLLNYSYSVQIPGHNHRLGAPSSILVGLESAEYDAATQTVTLTTTTPIHPGTPILVIINQVTGNPSAGVGVSDLAGILLQGNNDGHPGGVFMQTVIAAGPSVRPPTRHSSVEKGARLVHGPGTAAVGQTPHRARGHVPPP